MKDDWRISADERARYESYFQQCGPVQGYLSGNSYIFLTILDNSKFSSVFFFVSGEQARAFFLKSKLPGDILREIW